MTKEQLKKNIYKLAADWPEPDPRPTAEQYAEGFEEVRRSGDGQFSKATIRCAVAASIDPVSRKFNRERFWQELPEYAEVYADLFANGGAA